MGDTNQNKLKKISEDEFFNIKDFNENMEKLDSLLELLDDTGWINTGISFEGTVYSESLQYRKIGHEVHLRGVLYIFPDEVSVNLPEEIIPKETQKFKDAFSGTVNNDHVSYNYSMTTDILINNTGTITFDSSYAGESVYAGPKAVSLDGIRYLLN